MALNPGTSLGPYEILSAIGAGGMGACGRDERATCEASRSRVESLRCGGGAPRPFLKQTDLAHPCDCRWR